MFDVTIAGDINLDLILYGLDEQLPVEREVLATDMRLTLGGSSAITAHNLAALGCKVGFIGKIGNDDFGRIALDRLREAGVDLDRCVASTTTQTGMTVLLHYGGTRHIITYPGTIAELTINDLDVDYLANTRHFHISSFFLLRGMQAGLPELCRGLKANSVSISMDTNDDPDNVWGETFQAMLPLIDVLLPNEDEALRMAHKNNLSDALDWLSDRVPTIVVKCGSRGALVQNKRTRFELPATRVTPVDTVGAGDSFNAGFLSRFVSGATLEESAAFGNATAALSTLRAGGTESFRERSLMAQFFNSTIR